MINISLRVFCLSAWLFVGDSLSSVVYAQSASQNARVDANVSSEVRINQIDTAAFPKVIIFATVLKDGVPVAGLTEKDFRVREDEVDQEPLTVQAQLSALNAVITIDTSGSIKKALPQVQSAAVEFLSTLDEKDKFDVLAFARDVKVLSSNASREQTKAAILQTVARGDTALFDALYQSIAALKDRSGRKSVILLTDGVDDDGTGKQLSKHSLQEALDLAKIVNAPVFTIGLGPTKDVATLTKIAEASGGKYFDAISAEDLTGIYQKIGKEITGQYTIFYSSNLPADGTMHRVNLTQGSLQGIKEYESPKIGVSTAVSTAVVQTKQVVAVQSKEISSKIGLHVAASMSEGTEAVSISKIVVATKPKSAFEESRTVDTCYNEKTHCSFVVPTGRYLITVEKGDTSASLEVDVNAEAPNNVWVNLNSGLVRVIGVPVEGGSKAKVNKFEFVSDSGSSFKEKKSVATCYNQEICEVFLPAGSYLVHLTKGSARAQQPLTVAAAQVHEMQVNLNAGVLDVVSILTANTPAIKMTSVKIIEAGETALADQKEVDACYNDDKCSFVLNAGKYQIRSKYGEATASDEVEIRAGESVEKTLNLQAGVVRIGMLDAAGQPVVFKNLKVLEPSKNGIDKPTQIDSCYNSKLCEFKLAARKYLVELEYGEVEKSSEFELQAGQNLELQIK